MGESEGGREREMRGRREGERQGKCKQRHMYMLRQTGFGFDMVIMSGPLLLLVSYLL